MKNKSFKSTIISSMFLLLVGCMSDHDNQPSKHSNSSFAKQLDVKYTLLTNVPDESCHPERMDGNCFQVELTFTSPIDFMQTNWSIYYSQINPVQSDASDLFDIEHINGDLHRITPTKNFKGFIAGKSYSMVYRVDFWSLSETDVLPNYIFVIDGQEAEIIASTQTRIDPETGLEVAPFVQEYTSYEKHFKRTANDKTKWANAQVLFDRNQAKLKANHNVKNAIIPTPKSLQLNENGRQVDLAKGIFISENDFASQDINAALERLASVGVNQDEGGIKVAIKKSGIESSNKAEKGGYQLIISDDIIDITASSSSGAFYALQSLAGLISLDDLNISQMEINDAPHYEFRGMMVDVARNFHSKQFILDLLDQMSAYKLNKLHLHLGDDEGWRLEIPGLEELTELSSKRCFDLTEESCLLPQLGAGIDPNSSVNGYYTVDDYKQILRYASARHIQVIPSLDMPGHSRSSVVAMKARYNKYKALNDMAKAEQYLLHDPLDKTVYSSVQYYNDNTINVCLESSYDFISKVMDEVKNIHAQAEHPLTRYHIGADETAGAWLESPACTEFVANNNVGITDKSELGGYFIERLAKILSDKGIESAGWNDGLMHTSKEGMPDVVQANAWGVLFWQGHQSAHKLANRDWEVVASSPDVMYFDFPYEADPKEHGYYWAIRYSNTEKVFQFMPDNLPVHAEFWLDRQDAEYIADDRLQKNEDGSVKSAPYKKGNELVGVQGQLWSENTRNDDLAEYKIFPRLFSLAERAWHSAIWSVPYDYKGAIYSQSSNTFTKELKLQRDQSWANFADTIGKKELLKLDNANIHYRVPTVGAQIKDNKLLINSAYSALPLEYQINGGQWLEWTKPVNLQGIDLNNAEIHVRARSKNKKRAGRALKVSIN